MKQTAMIIAVMSGVMTASAGAADYRVERTVQLDVPSTQVWHVVGDYCDIDDWHPDISTCRMTVEGGKLFRVLTTTAGDEITEQRIAAEQGLSYTYKLSDGGGPITKLTATLSIEPNDGTLLSWAARFSSDDPAVEARVISMFETGLAAIKRHFESE